MGIIGTNSKEWKRLYENTSEINKRRGTIISFALEIEDTLEGVLSSYLMKESTPEKREFFEVEVLRPRRFEEKIQIFEKICKKERFNEEKLYDILRTIKSIQTIRNKVAHWRNFSILQTGKVFLRKKNERETQEMLVLTDDLLREIEDSTAIAKKGMADFHQWHYTRGVSEK